MKNVFTILGVIFLAIGLLCLGVWIVQILGNYVLDYFEVSIKRLNFMVTLAIVLLCGGLLNNQFGYKSNQKWEDWQNKLLHRINVCSWIA